MPSEDLAGLESRAGGQLYRQISRVDSNLVANGVLYRWRAVYITRRLEEIHDCPANPPRQRHHRCQTHIYLTGLDALNIDATVLAGLA